MFFRILIAEIPLHLGKPLDAMDRLYALLAKVEEILKKGNFNYLFILKNNSYNMLKIEKSTIIALFFGF